MDSQNVRRIIRLKLRTKVNDKQKWNKVLMTFLINAITENDKSWAMR